MSKALLTGLLIFFSTSVYATPLLTEQSFRVLGKGAPVGGLKMSFSSQIEDIHMTTKASGFFKMPNGTKKDFKAGSNHRFDKNWGWISSEIIMPLSKEVVKLTVSKGHVSIATSFGKKKGYKSFPYSGMVLPRRAFYAYLRSIQPPPILENKEIYLFNEMDLTMHKVTWVYLGLERAAAGNTRKYEIKGLNTIITIDEKANILKVKELDVGLELIK